MASEDKLTINRLYVHLNIGSKGDFKHFADRISRLTQSLLPNRINGLLRKYDFPEGLLIINKLEINLGRIDPYSFEKTIVDAIVFEISKYLTKYIEEIESEIKQAKFKASKGEKIKVKNSDFQFESTLFLEKSVDIKEQLKKGAQIKPVLLTKKINEFSGKIDKNTVFPIKQQINISEAIENRNTTLYSKESKKISEISSKDMAFSNEVEHTKPTNTILTELDITFLYFLKYGRLPSNVKYDLGTSMFDVFKINKKEESFYSEITKYVKSDAVARERLIRIVDESNKKLLVKKNVLNAKEIEGFDPKIPKAFEDYFIALVMGFDTSDFSDAIKRYNLNDMVRFFYADHPQKLRSMIKFLLLDYPAIDENVSERIESKFIGTASDFEKLKTKIKDFFEKLGKATIVKIISSFIRHGGAVNKYLNSLNKSKGIDVKAAHSSILLALLINENPITQLEKDGFEIDKKISIEQRVFSRKEPIIEIIDFSNEQIVDYFLTYGTIPQTTRKKVSSIEQLNIIILMMTPHLIQNLPYFKNNVYSDNLKYQSIGKLSEQAIEHIIKALNPAIFSDAKTKYLNFEYQIKAGVPKEFQRAFLMYFALKKDAKSYLEEMIIYWKKEFGDADSVIKKRWQVSEELGKQLDQLIIIKEVPLEKQLKVDYEFQSFSKDISVKNAGLVILWPFLRVYFNMLDLLNDKGDFRSLTERARACHLLQYLAVKQSMGEEFYYPLNKILTGYPLEEPLPYEIKMTEKEVDVSNALLKNVIKQWNALKGSSVDALRGSFLIRDGVLSPSTNGWLLTVEKKAYDMLLDKLPWGIGMIKLSWAPYVISVEWERKIM